MASYNLSSFAGAGAQFFDDNGDPLSGGKVFTYAAGTTTPLATYTTSAGTVANTNPIILDAAGRTPNEIWLVVGTLYKFIVKTSTDVLVGTYDGIPSINDPYSINALLGSVTGTNAIAAVATPSITAYAAGATYAFIATNTNTSAVTISIDGLAAKSITKNGIAALTAGDIQVGKLMLIEYDGTTFQLLNNIVYGGSVTNGTVTNATITGGTATALTLTNATISSLSAPLSVADGGTGQSSYTNGQLLIGNTTGNTLVKATLTAGTNVAVTNGAGSISVSSASITLSAAVASTSGTAVDFTSIPANARRITVMFSGVSTTGTSALIIQIGSTTFLTSGYKSAVGDLGASTGITAFTSGFGVVRASVAASVFDGSVVLDNQSGNIWLAKGIGVFTTSFVTTSSGSNSLSGVLDRLRVTTLGGSDTFDAGTISISWEIAL